MVVEAAVAALAAARHAAALVAECHAAASLVAAWARAVRVGTVLITVPAIGTALAIIGMGEMDMAITGTVIIGTATIGIMGIAIM